MLGAAVADDVMGLIVLTVVVRLVTEGSVSVLSVVGIVGVAVAFLVVGGLVGLAAAPRIFSAVDKVSRSTRHDGGPRTGLHPRLRRAGRRRQARPDRGRVRGRHRPGPYPAGRLASAASWARRPPLHPGVLPADRHRRRRRGVLQGGRCSATPPSSWSSPWSGSSCRPSGRSVPPVTSRSSASGCCPGARSGSSSPRSVSRTVCSARISTPPSSSSCSSPRWSRRSCSRSGTRQIRGQRHAGLARRTTRHRPTGGWLAVTPRRGGPGRPSAGRARRWPSPSTPPSPSGDAAPVPRCSTGSPRDRRTGRAVDPALTGKLLDVVERGNARSWRFLDTSGVFDRVLPELAEALRDRGSDGPVARPARQPPGRDAWNGSGCSTATIRSPRAPALEHLDRLAPAPSFLVDVTEDDADPGGPGRRPSWPACGLPDADGVGVLGRRERPRPPLVRGPPARRVRRGAGAAARRPPRHAGAGPGPLRPHRPAQRRRGSMGAAAAARALRARAGGPRQRRAGRERRPVTSPRCNAMAAAALLDR